ncbi:lipase family protein [Methylomarinum vadi]|uniref:lipase family protein n=1 Tax=Methylomarinum vadi TaxID=438855 RepID=UPI00068D609B|nr:lipase family protein [Methylomarinum vadi]
MRQNFTRDALYHCERLPVFSEHDPEWKFNARATELSLKNAWWLCNLSHLAYYDESDALPILQRMQLTLEAFIDDRQEQDSFGKLIKDTQAYIVANDDAVILTFRGTEPDQFKDVLADAYLHPLEFPGKGKVHGGFYGALSGDCWERIVSVLQRPHLQTKMLWITGHSLGAALATVAAAHLNPHGLYTFASPRVGDSVFCASFAGSNSQRFVNCSDLVTRVPLKDIMDYQHIETLQYFTAAGDWLENPDARFIQRDSTKARLLYPFTQLPIPFFSQKVAFRRLADHSIANYLYGIWKALSK